ncbi:bifunctional tRNA (5-methylaminomethyl-2-thiouridine)(34)-methyltransferase MnmD/FAD-dependent 5-carboxymethylaminomethyl-2-thiouridine(34) oxidoreductase MnmC [Salinicola aestuarinus]|uniref:bifunctional tRNA (5-methylaminomethyl-2-thiouridine)(34)-methyltransferase MnmD/FAD-dependent 5-carboxymethylaminomethyl-2-thiouridine(34) oxidoreductase MnmC n=1 Tax=Salinicola aestuarinus TaxID=1949082 RepID=UPI000DA24D3E|nr:bifunctional tRNA (5-methylaminomethyl-2-thiouridine)(34)-methyltransferase MnmD/FAD-dependent 5-carboxymethylaminomethyl-2-thiouridine(34) oxidoreductase MnmC [Salinicola aestuarinus]
MSDTPSRPAQTDADTGTPALTVEPAELEWRRDAEDREAPFSARYDDVYFSRHDGREESRFVFLAHNRLAERFGAWQSARPFVVGETGFGTGLNMLLAWACFTDNAPPSARLHLVSTEKHPMTREALARIWQSWPDLAPRAETLIAQWPDAVAGIHRLRLDPRVTLDLHIGDAAESLSALEGQVDAWFLDGFAPAKNPDMWHAGLFHAMASASHGETTFATFTCAGFVRRGLAEAGFSWRKVPGFGRKREMLCGSLASAPDDEARAATPWFTPPATRRAAHIAVIGAGIAGTSMAEALARRGSQVTLIDPKGIAGGASGNPQAALYVKLAAEPNRQSLFYLAALQHAHRWLSTLDPERTFWSDCGLLALAPHERENRRQRRFLDHYGLPPSVVAACNTADASRLAGIAVENDALHYGSAGWVDPGALCRRLADTPNVTLRQASLAGYHAHGDGWQLELSDGDLTVDQIVITAGPASAAWLDGLPLQPIRGQVSMLERDALPALNRVLCAEGYVLPPRHRTLTFGATFHPNDADTAVTEADHRRNLEELARTAPALAEALGDIDPASLDGRAAVRAASPDKTPYAGPLPMAAQWREDYAALAKDARRRFSTPGAHYPGVWVSAAHGSRGMVSAPLCAELIASRIHAEPLPLPRALVDHLHPGRRLIAELIRGQ